MSQTFIRRLFGAALVLPVILLAAQPSFASDDKKVEAVGNIKQSSESVESEKNNLLEHSAEGAPILEIENQNLKITPVIGVESTNEDLVEPKSGNPNYVYFNLTNRTGSTITSLYVLPYGGRYVTKLSGPSIPSGRSTTVTLRGYGTCVFRLGVQFANGRRIAGQYVNFCRYRNYYI